MPDRVRLPALDLHGLVLAAFVILGTGCLMLGRGAAAISMFFFCVFVAAVAGFNMHAVHSSARLPGEEERLQTEFGKDELRHERPALRAAARSRDATRPIEGPPA